VLLIGISNVYLKITNEYNICEERSNKRAVLLCGPSCTRWRGWLRYCATSRKVAGSIPFGVIPSGRTLGLASTQPLSEMSAMNIFWVVKVAGA
jgi:hypothetical protein